MEQPPTQNMHQTLAICLSIMDAFYQRKAPVLTERISEYFLTHPNLSFAVDQQAQTDGVTDSSNADNSAGLQSLANKLCFAVGQQWQNRANTNLRNQLGLDTQAISPKPATTNKTTALQKQQREVDPSKGRNSSSTLSNSDEFKLAVSTLAEHAQLNCVPSVGIFLDNLQSMATEQMGTPLTESELAAFKTSTLCNACSDALLAHPSTLESQLTLLKLLESHLFSELKQLYKDLNHYLVSLATSTSAAQTPDLELDSTDAADRRESTDSKTSAENKDASTTQHKAKPSEQKNESMQPPSVQQDTQATEKLETPKTSRASKPSKPTPIPAKTRLFVNQEDCIADLYKQLCQQLNMPSAYDNIAGHTPFQQADDSKENNQEKHLLLVLDSISSQQQREFDTEPFTTTELEIAEIPSSTDIQVTQSFSLVHRFFDSIRSDKYSNPLSKQSLSYLEVPLLRLARKDLQIFAKANHPVQKFLNTYSDLGHHWLATDDLRSEVYLQLRSIIRPVLKTKDLNEIHQLFTEGQNRLEKVVSSATKKSAIMEKRTLESFKGKAKLNGGRVRVKQTILAALQNETLPKPLKHLIAVDWAAFMTYIMMRHGEGSHEWNDAITIIENIMWYIEPKIGEQENDLAESIKDDLHEALRHGFSCIGLDNKQSDTHIKTLEMCRTLATENAETPASKLSAKHSDAQSPDNGSSADNHARGELEADELFVDEAQLHRLHNHLEQWFDWVKPNQSKQRVKLTWVDSESQNCLLTDIKGLHFATVSAHQFFEHQDAQLLRVVEDQGEFSFMERRLKDISKQLAEKPN